MSFLKTKTTSELASLARGFINGSSGHHQQHQMNTQVNVKNNMAFDVNAFMDNNPHLRQQQPAYQVYQGQPQQGQPQHSMYAPQRPTTSHGNGNLPTPTHTPPPPPVLPTLSTGNVDQGPKKFEMLYTNSLTSPGVQNAYVTQLPFGRASMSAQQIRQQQLQQVAAQQAQQAQQQVQNGQIPSSAQFLAQQQAPQFASNPQVAQLQAQQARANRRFSMQHVPMSYSSSTENTFPSQLSNMGSPPPQQQARHMSPPSMQICSPPPLHMGTPEPMNMGEAMHIDIHQQHQQQQQHQYQSMESVVGSYNSELQQDVIDVRDIRTQVEDRTAMNIRPMDLTEYLRITGPDDMTRHVPRVDMTEGTVSEFQHPDKESVVGQSMPLMNKLPFTRPAEEAFDSLMAWNGRRLTPYPTQTLGRTIRCEEDVSALADDFWLKPVHAATLTWLQAIDSARLDERKGASTRFTCNNYTNMDGIVEGEEVDPSMLHFGKLFTLYPPVLETSNSSARKQVCFFTEFCSPGVLSEEGAEELWAEGPLKNLSRSVNNKSWIHSFYSATRQVRSILLSLSFFFVFLT